jgi:hypothetical protein
MTEGKLQLGRGLSTAETRTQCILVGIGRMPCCPLKELTKVPCCHTALLWLSGSFAL